MALGEEADVPAPRMKRRGRWEPDRGTLVPCSRGSGMRICTRHRHPCVARPATPFFARESYPRQGLRAVFRVQLPPAHT